VRLTNPLLVPPEDEPDELPEPLVEPVEGAASLPPPPSSLIADWGKPLLVVWEEQAAAITVPTDAGTIQDAANVGRRMSTP
jgi:hypothetical protein